MSSAATGPPSSSSADAAAASSSSGYQTTAHSYRVCLERAVAAVLVESGFDTASSTAVQTLSELLQSFMYELGRSSREDGIQQPDSSAVKTFVQYCKTVGYRFERQQRDFESGWLVNLATLKSVRRRGVPLGAAARGRAAGAA